MLRNRAASEKQVKFRTSGNSDSAKMHAYFWKSWHKDLLAKQRCVKPSCGGRSQLEIFVFWGIRMLVPSNEGRGQGHLVRSIVFFIFQFFRFCCSLLEKKKASPTGIGLSPVNQHSLREIRTNQRCHIFRPQSVSVNESVPRSPSFAYSRHNKWRLESDRTCAKNIKTEATAPRWGTLPRASAQGTIKWE